MTTEQKLREELSELKSWDRVESVEVDDRVPGCFWLSTSGHGYLGVPRGHKYGKLARGMAEYGFRGYLATYLEEDYEAPAFEASTKALEHTESGVKI